ncbi:DUF4265 domain-containing protein [Pseudomonas entomophila]|uniref:DUF4265 domain-containing protein n=2 Tax=Pseudomonas entomophila TaxID=312306 RepID=Q1IFQ6_PSEE4|nr:DUF4265 domain-containing protein [Pseudomonas entomophila]WMW05663.1 DUF4265 domain-containing protein [Pseudomonas entomophila]CAK13498.1 conserved hypothetical protein [Pseudomonas entomophila L48]
MAPHSPSELRKLVFELVPDEDDYPPVASEAIWGIRLGPSEYRLDNTPWYVYGASKGDVVTAVARDGELIAKCVVRQGGHSTLRVYAEGDARKAKVVREITRRGGVCSVSSKCSLFAVDIPPDVAFAAIDDYLSGAVEDGEVEYEDACLQHPGIDRERVLECLSLPTLADIVAK